MYTFYFEKLDVWKDAKDLVKDIYEVAKGFPSNEEYGLVNQLKRAAVSVPTNLAEGTSRSTRRDQANYTSIAYASLMETLNLLIISMEMGFIESEEYKRLREQVEKVANKLIGLRKAQIAAQSSHK